MTILLRALTYATLFVALLLVFVPSRLSAAAGIATPDSFGVGEGIGLLVTIAGALLALWCVITFAFIGRGTPAPFDPPRRLVMKGPYRYVRNPMYLGAVIALFGAAVYYRSAALAGYAALFWLIAHAFVRLYEEPTLRRIFGEAYDRYCERVRRWRPRIRTE